MNPIDNNINVRPPVTSNEPALGKGDAADPSKRAGVSTTDARIGEADAAAGESVSITDTAAGLLQLEARLQSLPDVDQPRVDAIKAAIEDGSYEFNPDQIVSNLLRTEAELF